MTNEKIRKFGTGTADQSSLYFIGGRNTAFSDHRSLDDNVRGIKSPSISLCPASQREQSTYSGSGNFCCIYSQTATQCDQTGQRVCKFQGYVNWQSCQDSAGRFFSKKGSCPKSKDKLKRPIAMIGYGSKSSHRSIIFSSQIVTVISRIIFLNH